MAKRAGDSRKSSYGRWLKYVRDLAETYEHGKRLPFGPSNDLSAATIRSRGTEAAKILVAAPHPDDEALIGALAIRLRLEAGARVTDCAITLGSNVKERPRRLRELESACRVLGFGLVVPDHPSGLERVNLKNRKENSEEWAASVRALADLFDREAPDAVLAPHAEDFNTTHIGTHFLIVEALGEHLARTTRGPVALMETEFWHEHAEPNLMVGVPAEVVALQVMATAEHGGEVRRNPYHLRQPARMMNNVRRGSEVVGGQGGKAFPFHFAELYRVTFMRGREVVAPQAGGLIVGPKEKITLARLRERFWAGE